MPTLFQSTNQTFTGTGFTVGALRLKSTMAATAAYDQTINAFPSIVIGPDRVIVPQGSFAEAQAEVGAGGQFQIG
jgi:hypothetical protein